MLVFRRVSISLLIVGFFAVAARAAEPKSDAAALAEIFADQAASNVHELYRNLPKESSLQRYTQLRDAVFPPGRRAVRIDFEFLSTDAVDSILPLNRVTQNRDASRADSFLPTSWSRGQLLAPAIDLVDEAFRWQKTAELERLIDAVSTSSDHERKSRLAIQLLLAMQRDDLESIDRLMKRFNPLRATLAVPERELGPESVVMWNAARRPETREFAIELVFHFYELARNGIPVGSERFRRHVFALSYLLQTAESDPNIDWTRSVKPSGGFGRLSTTPTELSRWIPVSRQTAETVGGGYPAAQWVARSGRADNVTGHDRDYLVYAIPLTGNFSIEADVSPFDYRDTRLGFGGTWAGPSYDLKALLVGHFGRDAETQVIEPQLDEVGKSVRVTLRVQDGIRSTWINGRNVFQASASASDPWLSIFSFWYTHGWVENLRITGNPTIPRSIDLVSGKELHGWNSYFGPSLGHEYCLWESTQPTDSDLTGETDWMLRGRRHDGFRVGFDESLIQYHRPVIEDATFTYEFFYHPGEYHAHPAIGRTALLLRPDGVATHTITDGIHDRTNRSPIPGPTVAASSSDDTELPLKENAWNDVALHVTGNRVTVELNGERVFDQSITTSGQRLFGFFHYADQSESRIRKIAWHGAWPDALPAPRDQQLADNSVERLLAGAELPATFHHEFSEGFATEKFLVSGLGWKEGLRQHSDGAELSLKGQEWMVHYNVWPQLQIEGDFDVIAEFDQFGGSIAEGGDVNIQLFIGFEEDSKDYRLYRKFSRFAKKELGQQIVQAGYFHSREGHRTYEFPHMRSEAATGGKLRLSRRGAQMHYLFAAAESDAYRLLHSESVPTQQTKPGGFSLVLESTKPGDVSVVWKSLDVRAEKLSGLATQPAMNVAQIDQTRDALSDHLTLDLTDGAAPGQVGTWGKSARFEYTPEGLRLTGPGFDNWEGHGFFPAVAMSGDFDVSVELDLKTIQLPAAGGESVVYLETDFQDALRTAIQVKFALSPEGVRGGEIQINRLGGNGQMEYTEIANVSAKTVHTLRIARRDGMAYFLLKEAPDAKPVLLGRFEVGELPVSVSRTRVMAHTAGSGRQIVVLYKNMTFHADDISR